MPSCYDIHLQVRMFKKNAAVVTTRVLSGKRIQNINTFWKQHGPDFGVALMSASYTACASSQAAVQHGGAAFASALRFLVAGKDVKRLRADAAEACPGLSEAALDELVPLKASVQMQKLANRAVVYSVADGEPLFFEVWCWWARWWVYLA